MTRTPEALGRVSDRRLDAPPEPVALRNRYRAEALADPSGVRSRLAEGAWIADYLFAEWSGELTSAGVTAFDVAGQAARQAREMWLWLMGERLWDDVASLVIGGVLRRAGSHPIQPGVSSNR